MRIFSVSNINYINNQSLSKFKPCFFSGLTSDIFKKNASSVSEESDFQKFKKWAEDTNLAEKLDAYTSINTRVLSKDSEGTVYEISNNDKWVIKQYRCSYMLPISNKEPKIYETDDILPEFNVGQHIARVEVPNDKFYSSVYHILKKQSGKPYGVGFAYSNTVNSDTSNLHLNSLKSLSELPQSTFDKCIDDISYLTKNGYKIDCNNPNNILLDLDKKQINFVDISDKKKDDSNQYGEVLFSLLGSFFTENFYKSEDVTIVEKELARIYSNEIITKFFNAMQIKHLKFSDGEFFHLLEKSSCFSDRFSKENLKNLDLI